jgi:manganese efflux pump family protein
MGAALILVAVSVGLSNLAASVGIGVGGIDRRTRLRVGIIFGLFEAAMPVAGLLIGRGLAGGLGRAADWLAAVLLILVGGAGIVGGMRARATASTRPPLDRSPLRRPQSGASGARSGPDDPVQATETSGDSTAMNPWWRWSRSRGSSLRSGADRGRPGIGQLVVSGFALSLDNVVAGFALGSYQVSVLAGVVVFGVVSAAMSLAGLEFGARIGSRAGEAGRIIGGVLVAGVGVAIGVGALG